MKSNLKSWQALYSMEIPNQIEIIMYIETIIPFDRYIWWIENSDEIASFCCVWPVTFS